MTKLISTHLDKLADRCLDEDQYQHYTDTDLLNACTIFSHVLLDVMYTENVNHLAKEELEYLAQTTGKAIRELVRASTDKDMHEVAKNLTK